MGSTGASCICIIGGGAAGLSALKILLEAEEYKAGKWELILYEAREQLGGVWLPSPPNADPPVSPLYDGLTTNIPHPVMAFQSYWFPPATPLFPPASAVLAYLQAYAATFGLIQFVRFNTRVEEALWHDGAWSVRLSNGTTRRFDRLVVANGHYSAPRYPPIPGLRGWLDSGRASHSVSYRNPRPYAGARVLVIGGGPSGHDISAEVCAVAAAVYHSVRGGAADDAGSLRRRGLVARLDEAGVAVFDDGSAARVDRVVLATGYAVAFPFLPQLRPGAMPHAPALPPRVLNSTYGVFPLARHIFALQDDFPAETLAFVGLLVRVAPFPLFEAQARFISRVFRHPGALDRAGEAALVLARYRQLQEAFGDEPTVIAKQWHKLPTREQFAYRRELGELADAGAEWGPEDWVEEMYCAKGQLRSAWVRLEKNGQSEEWIRGVGEGGRHEWVAMMRRLLRDTDA